jgi:redox-sensitive bicupin YhaK (pirin superfamily)
MDRKDFIKKSLMTGAATVAASSVVASIDKKDNLADQVGFNHLPNSEQATMNSVFHPADTRGHANHGWLDAHHSFSFANYYNPERMNFGVLRVLNDDRIAGGGGFPTHPHKEMEIITIPMEGMVEHKDSIGNSGEINAGDVQVMSAGTGIKHSEFNGNADSDLKLLQIWMFPNKEKVEPRYDQISLDAAKMEDQFLQILSPNAEDEGVWVHQNAWFNLGEFKKETTEKYAIQSSKNGLYIFIMEGGAEVNGQVLGKRDAYGIWNTENVSIKIQKDSKLLLLDVPMS